MVDPDNPNNWRWGRHPILDFKPTPRIDGVPIRPRLEFSLVYALMVDLPLYVCKREIRETGIRFSQDFGHIKEALLDDFQI